MQITVRLDNGNTKRVETPPHIGKQLLSTMTETTQRMMFGGIYAKRYDRSIHGRQVN